MRVIAGEMLVLFERVVEDRAQRRQWACEDGRLPSECVPIAMCGKSRQAFGRAS